MIHNKPIDTMNILLATAQTVVGLNCQQPLFIADEMVSFVSEERHICLEINRLQRHHTKHGQMKVPWHLSEWELEVMGALGAQQLLSPWSGDLPWTSVCLVLFPHLTREGGWSSEGKISGLVLHAMTSYAAFINAGQRIIFWRRKTVYSIFSPQMYYLHQP